MVEMRNERMENQQMEQQEPLGKRIVKEILDLVRIFIICFVSIFLITQFIVKPIRVEGSSMYPTLEDGEIGLTNVFAVKFLGISRYDVVIVYNTERDEHWVKRVIGMPQETIEGKDDIIYINGEPIEQAFLDEAYIKNAVGEEQFTSDFGPVTLAQDEYFLMGDNRYRSEDSRVHGPFKESEITGKDTLILFPFNKFKLIRNTEE